MSPRTRLDARTRRFRRRLVQGALVGLGAALLVVLLRPTPPLRVAESKAYDARAAFVADPEAARDDIVFVAIDENSMARYRDVLGRWPWSRDVYDGLLAYLYGAGAKLVVFDVLFPEPDLSNPLADTLFAEALEITGLGVLGFTLSPGTESEAREWGRSLEEAGVGGTETAALLSRFRLPVEGSPEEESRPVPGPDFPYAEPPHPLFLGAAAGAGSVVLNADPDGVARRDRLVYGHRGEVFPSLALAAARILEPDRFGGPVSFDGKFLGVGEMRIPVGADGRMLLRFRGPYLRDGGATYPIHPIFRILASAEQIRGGVDPDLPLETFEDKIVLVAVTATGTGEFDVGPTPLGATEPGAMVHATALDNLLEGDFLRVAGPATNLALTAGAGLAAGTFTAAVASGVAAALGALLLVVLLMAGTTVALSMGVHVELIAPVAAASLAFAGTMVVKYMTEGREKRRVRDIFSRYVAPEYVSRLADDFESLELGGERTEVSILFSDIRGFTTLSENLPASEVVDILNEYLESMAEVVFRYGGTLDKFIGDAVMAFWGAPVPMEDHATRAVGAALEMIAELEELNDRWEEKGLETRLAIGVGVNTGNAIVGNIGSLTRKLDYTAIGDAVNLASRVEGLNKQYETSVLVTESTAAAVNDSFELRLVEAVTVKGKAKAVDIYEVLGRKAKAAEPRGEVAGLSASLLLAGALLLTPAWAGAQESERARWTDWIYAPGSWVAGDLAALSTTDPETDSLALLARVEVYSLPPAWRAEVAKVADGETLENAVVVIGGQEEGPVVLTQLGSTPLAEHAAGDDAVVRQVVEGFRPDGVALHPPPARIVERSDGGTVRYVVVRRAVARAEFDEDLLAAGSAGRLGRSLGRFGAQSLAGERRTEVVASAGARGAARVRTVDGEIVVQPDTTAVREMEAVEVGILELERFLRELGQPADTAGTPGPGEVKP